MSLTYQSAIEVYWHREKGNSFIRSTHVPRDLWNDMHVYMFHFTDATLDEVERTLNQNFRKYWRSGRRVSIDESMRKFKGRWSGKVYISNKPTKWGLKYYMMVDELDYCVWFKLYRGANKEDPTIKQKTRHLVNEALDTLPTDMGAFAVYCDNYYGSLDLAEDTDKRGFGFTFACKANRPSWLFQEGTHKIATKHGGVEKFGVMQHKQNKITAPPLSPLLTYSSRNSPLLYQSRCNKDRTSKRIKHQEKYLGLPWTTRKGEWAT
jgi:hypothetical protein